MKKTMKRICSLLLAGTFALQLCPAFTASAGNPLFTPLIESDSAILIHPEGYTATTKKVPDGTIYTEIVSTENPYQRWVDYIEPLNQQTLHAYTGTDFIINVTPADDAAFHTEFDDDYWMKKNTYQGSYRLIPKTAAENPDENEIAEIINFGESTWEFTDAEKEIQKLIKSDSVESAAILAFYTEYSTNYLTGSPNASLKLFADAPVTESDFDFLPDGYTVEIDRDPEHPSVRLLIDGNPAETLEFHYQYYYDFYCAILENMPDVYAIFVEYDYPANFPRYRGHYDVLKEYRRTPKEIGASSVTRYFCMEAEQYLYYDKETDAWYGADGNRLKDTTERIQKARYQDVIYTVDLDNMQVYTEDGTVNEELTAVLPDYLSTRLLVGIGTVDGEWYGDYLYTDSEKYESLKKEAQRRTNLIPLIYTFRDNVDGFACNISVAGSANCFSGVEYACDTTDQPVARTWCQESGGGPVDYLMPGDINLSGSVTVADAVLLARVLAEDSTMTISELSGRFLDVDSNGKTEADDLTFLLRQLAGIKA